MLSNPPLSVRLRKTLNQMLNEHSGTRNWGDVNSEKEAAQLIELDNLGNIIRNGRKFDLTASNKMIWFDASLMKQRPFLIMRISLTRLENFQ